MPKRTHDGLLKRCKCGNARWGKCLHPWLLRMYHDGKEHFVTLNRHAKWPKGVPMSKTEAMRVRDLVRAEIRTAKPEAEQTTVRTVGEVIDAYESEFVCIPTRREHARISMQGHLRMARRLEIPGKDGQPVPFTSLPAADVRPSDIEALRHARRIQLADADAAFAEVTRREQSGADVPADLRQRSRLRTRGKGGEVGINRLLARLRHMFTWAITRYPDMERHPFHKGNTSVVKLAQEQNRDRRLRAGELDALLNAAPVYLRRLIVAALNTGCRIGELLSLQWHQVERDANGRPCRVRLTGQKTKTARTRVLPVSNALRDVLDALAFAPDDQPHAGDRYVFGNDVGERIDRIQTAWETACRRAGIEGLHFHDLRREFGSRLLDQNVALTVIQNYLGHTTVTTTAKYLQADQQLIATSVDAVDRGWAQYGIRTFFGLSEQQAS